MTAKLLVATMLVTSALQLVTVSHAQLAKPTAEELARRGGGPGPVAGGAASTMVTTTVVPPSTDPRDFSGTWRQARGGPGAAGSPPTGGPPPGSPERNPAGNAASGSGRLPDRILCLPQSDPVYTGVDGPTLLVQTPGQITWVSEEMHHIRRIFLTGTHAASSKPSYLGEAVAHWDGGTLVVETRQLQRQPPGTTLVERWTKSGDGRTVEIRAGMQDANGQSTGNPRALNLSWTPGQQVLEWICEDFNDEWLPGGADFDDQVGK
jgi:hypothetical protein